MRFDHDAGRYLLAVSAKDYGGRRAIAPHQTAAVFRDGRLVVMNAAVMTGLLADVLDILREAEAGVTY